MTTDEACSLILQTILFDEAPVYCFEMGDPLEIERLARKLIQSWYPAADPDALIEYIGRRPGEKLSEELIMPYETPTSTPHESIIGLDGAVPCSRTELDVHFRRLRTLSEQPGAGRAQLRQALFASDLDTVLDNASQ